MALAVQRNQNKGNRVARLDGTAGNLELPNLYRKQALAMYSPARFACIEASTKSGKTTGCIAWILELAWISEPFRNYWWVAPVRGQAKIAYNRIKNGLEYTAGVSFHDSNLQIIFPSLGVLSFKSAENPDNLYGDDVYAAVIDEASRTREESYTALYSTLTATRGPMRLIGNVKGRKNWFYKLCRKAEAGERGMSYHKLTAYDAVEGGVIDLDIVEDAKRMLPADVFGELYLAEPTEDGANPFGIANIRACIAPLSAWKPVAFGVDLAKSVDWTVAIGLDQHKMVSRFDRFQRPWNTTITNLRGITGQVQSLVDSTGVGDPVLEALQVGRSNYEGFKFTSVSKQQLIENLVIAVQNHEIKFPEGPISIELENFEYEYTRQGVRYSAPEGLHDDCVVALALAWRKHGNRAIPSFAKAGQRQIQERRV
jgi:Terminase large subunit, T4likevirus-type, N-terminal